MIGFGIFLLFAFVLPSRYSYNPLAELLRVFMGVALLLPVPLAITSLVFFVIGAASSRADEARGELGLAVAGLAMSAASATIFFTVALLAPGL